MSRLSEELVVTLITVWWLQSDGEAGNKYTNSTEVWRRVLLLRK
jgi:hypothetical protein